MFDKTGSRARTLWTLAITSVGLFMVVLDNLVVSTALPVIRVDLGASIEELEWTVNAYTLTFAVFLLTGAALGDRFGRRRMFAIGIALFTVASAAAALAPSMDALIAARAAQGLGGALVMPLTLTILSDAFPAARRGVALGIWGAVGGIAIASGPLVGGLVIEGISWQWVFWLNVPVGIALVPLAITQLRESHGPEKALDLPGLALASAGLLGVVWGLVNGNGDGWSSPSIVASLAGGVALLVAFVLWELRTPRPMLPMRFFRNRAFAAANGASLAMSFGMFGSIFLLTQFFQTAQGYSPLEAGLRVLPWTAMPMVVAPIAGALSDKIGSRPILATGLALQAIWPGLDRRRLDRDGRLHVARRAVHPVGYRHGDVLRTDGERHPQLGQSGRGGQGVRREQRHARGRRRVRRRGARVGVLAATAGTRRRRRSTTVSSSRRGSARSSSPSGAVAALAIPGKVRGEAVDRRARAGGSRLACAFGKARNRPRRVRFPVFPARRERVRGDHALGLRADLLRLVLREVALHNRCCELVLVLPPPRAVFVRTRSSSWSAVSTPSAERRNGSWRFTYQPCSNTHTACAAPTGQSCSTPGLRHGRSTSCCS